MASTICYEVLSSNLYRKFIFYILSTIHSHLSMKTAHSELNSSPFSTWFSFVPFASCMTASNSKIKVILFLYFLGGGMHWAVVRILWSVGLSWGTQGIVFGVRDQMWSEIKLRSARCKASVKSQELSFNHSSFLLPSCI